MSRLPTARQTMELRPVAERRMDSAKCPRCARALHFPTDTNGIVIETCPACGPLRAFGGRSAARAVPTEAPRQQGAPTPGRVCRGCGHPLRGKQRLWCGTDGRCAAETLGKRRRHPQRTCTGCGVRFQPTGSRVHRCVACKRQHPAERGRAA